MSQVVPRGERLRAPSARASPALATSGFPDAATISSATAEASSPAVDGVDEEEHANERKKTHAKGARVGERSGCRVTQC
jgi:hypothetical protein